MYIMVKLVKERIISIVRPTAKGKKYKANIKNMQTNKTRTEHFGAIGFGQYKDQTTLKLYSSKNHLDPKRRKAYYNRHSNVDTKKKAIKKEFIKSNGLYTPKILSHLYLW
jgi:hypothetical protein